MYYPPSLQKIIEVFAKFPGIGPRQATRFAFFLLKDRTLSETLVSTLEELQSVGFCSKCFRSTQNVEKHPLCSFCRDPKRRETLVAVVEKESDMQNLEKTGAYTGLYHVLGGVISPLYYNSPKKIHLGEFHARIKTVLEKNKECEVILATNPTTEGDTTSLYIERVLTPLKNVFPEFKISRLGRGLSLGSELEHVDEITLKNALVNRK